MENDVYIQPRPAPKPKAPDDTMGQMAETVVNEIQNDSKVLASMLQKEMTGGYVDVGDKEAMQFRKAQEQTQGGMTRWQQQVGTKRWLEQLWDMHHVPQPFREAYLKAVDSGMKNAEAIRYAQVMTATPREVG